MMNFLYVIIFLEKISMNKSELIKLIESLNMPKNMYRVNSGGAL